MGSPEWSDYVMSHFLEDELIDGKPTVAGLRRVAQVLLGEIINSRVVNMEYFPDSGQIGRVFVIYEISWQWKHGFEGFVDPVTFQFPIKTFSDCSDACSNNASYSYAIHTAALASTRAESRVLRKALQLKVISAEEITGSENHVEQEPITKNQLDVLQAKCSTMKIDMTKLAEMLGLKANPLKWLKTDGASLLSQLNKYQSTTSDSQVIPEEIKL